MKDTRHDLPPEHVPLGLIPTPFQPRLEPLSRTKDWMNWAGYISPAVLDTMEFEYFAIRNQATLFDISPMHKYRVSGPEALGMLNRLVTRDVRKLAPGRVAYVMWCDEDGMVIDDGTLFRLSETEFRLCCQEPQFSWLLDAAWGYDVRVEDESHSVAGLSLQGPTSASVLLEAGFEIDHLRPFDLAEAEPGLLISRTGFTGDLGYELWISPDHALALWDRLWDAGQTWGIRAIGYHALNMARIEAGFIAAGVEFQPIHHTLRLHRGRTPVELGFAWLVDFDKGHFNGRRALVAQAERGPRSMIVKLDIGGFKPAADALIYYRKKREVGHITSAMWSPTLKRNIALAEVRAPFGPDRTKDLWVEIYLNQEGVWQRRMARATVLSQPFFRNPRARATPPAAF
ncbi:aminomethyltransferase family protein [Ruegeria aquimaris]|uniref:Aminomethyltransferase family protein n=1 Tax=Ruegeria aquimaris TaxID=2984333 RepID=A0ABT3ANR1_9RHOB|nr:aminomethyltransferase family protein [Ruegeria sp. XHP0148]MCV2890291.1 aminomethyltransferase family protein [Ruegeria sp. XHP0148]